MSEEFDHCQPHVTLPPEGCDLVGVAEQIVMWRFQVDCQLAHALLVRAAHQQRSKLFDVCTRIRDTHYRQNGHLLDALLPVAHVDESELARPFAFEYDGQS